jgi:hypothetical protein
MDGASSTWMELALNLALLMLIRPVDFLSIGYGFVFRFVFIALCKLPAMPGSSCSQYPYCNLHFLPRIILIFAL